MSFWAELRRRNVFRVGANGGASKACATTSPTCEMTHAEALRELRTAETMLGSNRVIISLVDIVYGYGRIGRRDDVARIYAEIQTLASTQDIGTGGCASVYLGIGDEAKALLGHAHSARGSTFWFQGKLAAAAESARRSVELEPVATVFRFLLILYLIALRDLDAAVSHAHFMLEVDKNGWQAHYALGLVQYAREQYAAATASFEAAVGHSGGSPVARSALICALAHAGQRPRAASEHETLLAARANGYVPAVNVAAACVGLGLADSAFEWLEKAIEEMDTWVTTAWWNPLFVELRQDSRMLDLMRRFGPLHEAAALGQQ